MEAGIRKLAQRLRMLRRLGRDHRVVGPFRGDGVTNSGVVAAAAAADGRDFEAELAENARVARTDRPEADDDRIFCRHRNTS